VQKRTGFFGACPYLWSVDNCFTSISGTQILEGKKHIGGCVSVYRHQQTLLHGGDWCLRAREVRFYYQKQERFLDFGVFFDFPNSCGYAMDVTLWSKLAKLKTIKRSKCVIYFFYSRKRAPIVLFLPTSLAETPLPCAANCRSSLHTCVIIVLRRPRLPRKVAKCPCDGNSQWWR